MIENNNQQNQQKNNQHVMLSFLGIAFLVIGLVGVSFAFYNYTKKGSTNLVSTGRIYFDASQGDTITLNNLFPITVATGSTITSNDPGVGSIAIHVTGDTNYESGLEYLVTAVDVTSVTSGSALPISIVISYENNGTGTTIGEEDNSYFTNRGGNTSLYKVLSTDTISEGQNIVVGYIAPGNTGIDGNIVIMAYLDAANIAITETYNGTTTPTDAMGTESSWVNNRVVFTPTEWHALSSNGVSFKIKVEAHEGTWVNKLEGNVIFSTTSENSANVVLLDGDYKIESSVRIETDAESGAAKVVVGNAYMFKYNSSTGNYDDITLSSDLYAITANFICGNSSFSRNAVGVTGFRETLELLDVEFVYNKISNLC